MFRIKILRYNPEKNEEYIEEYEIPKRMKIIEAMEYINKKYGANIALRYYCRIGKCKSCLILMNDRVVYACKEYISNNVILKPIKKPIKDFIT